jgi:CheY-like chemotaxis protein
MDVDSREGTCCARILQKAGGGGPLETEAGPGYRTPVAKRILVVDDDRSLREMLTDRLTSWGYETVEAADGRQAWDAIETKAPDLILLDYRMPEVDGAQLCRAVKAHEKHRRIPVIFTTASQGLVTKGILDETKADGVLMKPFRSEQLLQMVRLYIGP